MNHKEKKEILNKSALGFTLIEVLVAISIFSMSIVVLMFVLGGGIYNTNYTEKKIIASYLAQEGIESLRNMRDSYVFSGGGSGWDSFKSAINSCVSGARCGFDNSFGPAVAGFIFSCSSPPNNCALYLNNGNYNSKASGSVGVLSPFVRTLWRDPPSADEVKVYSSVSWSEGSKSYNVTFSAVLFNWIE